MTPIPPAWQARASAKREAILSAIPTEWRIPAPIPTPDLQPNVTGTYIQQYLSPREIEITESDTEDIVSRTTTGTWTAVEVASAFCHRAALAHQLVPCLLEICFDRALSTAKALDSYFTTHQKPLGPLHGLPISLKDQFHMSGVETTMGYVGWIDTFEGKPRTSLPPHERDQESELVRLLRASGAVFYCKTSVPTTLMAGETCNNILGYTYNPVNRHLSAGGSSGGEGALLALRGSTVGFGTDIGGSIRVPAAFNGIHGLRPSAGRLPFEGVANSMDGQNTILSVVGPMATSVQGLKLLVQAVLAQEPWFVDPLVVEMPWRHAAEERVRAAAEDKGLAFAIMEDDGTVRPHPPVQRALGLVRSLLEQKGHRVIDWNPPSHATAFDIAMQAWHMDGGTDVQAHRALAGEEQLPECFLQPSAHLSAAQVAALNVKKRNYQKAYMDYWNSTATLTGTARPVDALICPACPSVAVRPGRFKYGVYTTFVNVLDYSSAVLPVTKVDCVVDGEHRPAVPLSEMDAEVRSDYECDDCHGSPVALQLVGRRFEEEKVLSLVEYVEGLINEATQRM
ncbi:putative general amidase GmdA [Aspergillus aculeatinus CBS 121060]|uniref:General amidase GmdA n=1 Tax=Aspergillus aculeatinus CBS 121060 TaxID=1448322 RepID=A0ACD1GT81_9EURO|nr:putative general amidase GmdA [Aspergillus aculeatinus CBS 121060]RAH64570.1 putative general amidase GmdA [Aspergillus aculeatinus CBS 121060]